MMRTNKILYETTEFDKWGHEESCLGLSQPEKSLLRYIGNKGKGTKILELGCGGGRILNNLTKLGFNNVIGLDYVFGFTVLARKIGYPIINADAIHLPVKSSTIDTVIAFEQLISFLEKKQQREKLLSECRRVLLPGGRILFSAHNFDNSDLRRKLLFFLINMLRVIPCFKAEHNRLLPWLKRGGRPNLRFFYPNEPLVYWHKIEELHSDCERAGFSLIVVAALSQVYCVAIKPEDGK